MNVLALHTAGGACDICIAAETRLTHRIETMSRGQDAALPSLLNDTLKEANLNLKDIDRVSIVTGPGSFTGLRIGLAFARGLGLALGVPVIGVNTLEAAASLSGDTPVRVALMAKKRPPDRSWWVDTVEAGRGAVRGPQELGEEALAALHVRDPRPIVTDDTNQLGKLLPGASILQGAPSAVTAAQIACQTEDPTTRPPLAAYVREPDADLPKARG